MAQSELGKRIQEALESGKRIVELTEYVVAEVENIKRQLGKLEPKEPPKEEPKDE